MSDTHFMLDTSVFNAILDGSIPAETFTGHKLIATHVQRDELAATPDVRRRESLTRLFETFVQEDFATSSVVWGVSKWGQAKWGNSRLHNQMLERLKQLDAAAKKKPRNYNQQRDVLIALTAVENGHTLVSRDASLIELATEFGGKVWHLK